MRIRICNLSVSGQIEFICEFGRGVGLWRGPKLEVDKDYDVELSVDENLEVGKSLSFLETLDSPSLSVEGQTNVIKAEICEYFPEEKLLLIRFAGTHLMLDVAQAPPPNMKAVELRARNLQLYPTTI